MRRFLDLAISFIGGSVTVAAIYCGYQALGAAIFGESVQDEMKIAVAGSMVVSPLASILVLLMLKSEESVSRGQVLTLGGIAFQFYPLLAASIGGGLLGQDEEDAQWSRYYMLVGSAMVNSVVVLPVALRSCIRSFLVCQRRRQPERPGAGNLELMESLLPLEPVTYTDEKHTPNKNLSTH